MSDRRRNLFMIGLFIFIVIGIFFFGRFLSVDDFTKDQKYNLITRTATAEGGQPTPTQSVTTMPTLPYDATFYAQRRLKELELQTGAGPTEYARFFATETALVATYQGTILPTFTPIPYTADMSPTALPAPSRTPTAKPTLCPPSDVVCPGGNATLSPAQQVFVLMASAEGTEFRQLALTATALATSPTPTEHSNASLTPTPTESSPQCIWTWARKDLPDVTEAAQLALTKAGLKNVTVRSEAYGENCVDSRNNKIAHFAAMTTDFYLAATLKSLDDVDELGQVIISAYNTLTTLNIKLPAGPGYLDIVFSAEGQSKQFRTLFSQLKPLINGKKSSAELLAAGGVS